METNQINFLEFFQQEQPEKKEEKKPKSTKKKELTSLQKQIKETKDLQKQKNIEEIEAILKHKKEILQKLLNGAHYQPEDNDEQESTWLAGRGGQGILTKSGKMAKVALVGLYPGIQEIQHKPPAVMVGPSSKFLDKMLSYCVPNTEGFYRTNLIKYFKKPKSKISLVEKTIGKEILFAELQAKNIEYVICLGAEVYDVLIKDKKRFSAAKFRGTFLPESRVKIPVKLAGLQHPAHIMSKDGEKDRQNFEDALRNLLETVVNEEQKTHKTPPFEDISTIKEIQTWYKNLRDYTQTQHQNQKKVILTIDTETTVENSAIGLTPKDLILITTSYGTTDAKTPDQLINNTWTLLKTPDWDYFTPEEQELVEEKNQPSENLTFNIENTETTNEDDPEPEEEPETIEEKPIIIKNFIINNSEEGQKEKTKLQKALKKGFHIQALNEDTIQQTEINTPQGHALIGITLTNAMKAVDYVGLQHGHFDKVALEKTHINWEKVCTKPIDENSSERESDPKFLELMIETLTTDENENRGLKEICSKELKWHGYDIPLELYKAEHDITSYLHIPWKVLAPYAVFDSAGTLLAILKKREFRPKKWEANKLLIDTYYKKVEDLRKAKLSDPQNYNPETVTEDLNKLMMPLFSIKKDGMPVGEKGLKRAKELVDYYETHYQKLRQETSDMSFEITGHNLQDPGSIDQINFILYGEKKRGGLELEPFKEPGKGGRLWSELKANERLQNKGKGAIDGESFAVLESRQTNPTIKAFIKKLGQTRQIKSIRDNFFADPTTKEKGFFARITDKNTLHTEYMPTTETLRFRSQPNLANPPKKESKWVHAITGEYPPWELRNIVCAQDGYVLHCRDWTSAEVYKLMYLSNDPVGLEVIQQQLDFHIQIGINASKIIQKSLEDWKTKNLDLRALCQQYVMSDPKLSDMEKIEKLNYLAKLYNSTKLKDGYKLLKIVHDEIRSKIKPVTFGVPYGQTVEGLARANNMEIWEAEEYIKGYHATYKIASQYLKIQGEFAADYRILPTPWGYLRNFSQKQNRGEVERQAFNLQLQHGVAYLMMQTINDWVKYKSKYKFKTNMWLSLYDAGGWHIPENEIQNVAEITHEIMTTKRPVGPFDNRTIPTEGDFTEYWEGKHLKEYSFPELNV